MAYKVLWEALRDPARTGSDSGTTLFGRCVAVEVADGTAGGAAGVPMEWTELLNVGVGALGGGAGSAAGDTAGGGAGDRAGSAAGDTAGGGAGDRAGSAAGDLAGSAAGDTAGGAAGDRAGSAAGDLAGSAAGDTAGGAAGDRAGGAAGDLAGSAADDTAGGAAGDLAGSAAGGTVQESGLMVLNECVDAEGCRTLPCAVSDDEPMDVDDAKGCMGMGRGTPDNSR
ncbi:hypothetical protein OC834_002101 [Tilletia horrida]|nr:hypothetical protein OC835_003304 [Tilletia horrida]KAK0533845.1 hypothetical protein OC834_002101 [Tilletia horrida]